MNENITTQNAQRLATLSAIFCLTNGIFFTAELGQILAAAVMANITKWYADNGRPDFSPETELICDDAIKAAFTRIQAIATLADIAARMETNMDGPDC